MSKAKKPVTAVDIARDVLRLLKTKKLIVRSDNTYCAMTPKTRDHIEKYGWAGKSLQRALKHMPNLKCEVCALGACFLAHVDLENKIELRNNFYSRDMDHNLEGIFSKGQLAMIESAFERRFVSRHGHFDNTLRIAVDFGENIQDDTARLRAIMKNIIKNDGVFIPSVS